MNKKAAAMLFALLAAALYALNAPLSKLLLKSISPTMLAGLLYLGAGVGMAAVMLGKKIGRVKEDLPLLSKSDLPFTVAMVVLDIAAPIFLMYGISLTTAANASLLNNLEIVATSVIALTVFKEKISSKLWLGIGLVTLSGVILSFEGETAFTFNKGSLLVLCACVCWGVENNCTRSISDKNPEQIVLVKGMFSGLGSVVTALAIGECLPPLNFVLPALLLGFVAYGLSIKFYITAQNTLGAARTGAFYSVAPFIGVGFSFLLVGESPSCRFYIAFGIMALSAVVMAWETLSGEKDKK